MKRSLLKTAFVSVALLTGTTAWADDETTSTFTSSASAYVDATTGNTETNFNGSSLNNLSVSNTQFRDGTGTTTGSVKFTSGKLALYKFDLTDIKKLTGTITKATFKFNATSTDNCYNIRALGYNETWDETTITQATLTNNGKDGKENIPGTVAGYGSFQPLGTTSSYSCDNTSKTLEADALTYLQSAIDAEKEYVSFAIIMNLGRTLSVATSATLEIITTTAEQTTYTIKFQDANGTTLKDDVTYDCSVGDEITASETDLADFYSTDGTKKYTYASGNTTTSAVSGGNTITLVFKELGAISLTVNAVDADNNTLLESIATATGYECETLTAYYSKYIKVNDQWYVTETKTTEPYLGIAATTTTEANVTYTPSNIVYFVEAENLTTNKSAAWAAGTDTPKRFSQGKGYRLAANSYAYTEALTGGIYNLTIFSRHTKSSDQSVSLYVRASDGTLTDLNIDYTTSQGTSEHDAGQVTIPDGYSLVIYNDASWNSNVLLDYLYLSPVTDEVSITNETGFSTYCPISNGVTFPETDATIAAYKATISENTVKLTRVYDVATGEGVLLHSLNNGTATQTVTVTTSTSKNNDNAFVGVTEDTYITSGYVLNNVGGVIGFYAADATANSNQGTKVTAGKAYLPATSNAKSLKMVFADDETNGIESIKTVKAENNVFYNLNGQRIMQPTKGLYIVNGKKVILK